MTVRAEPILKIQQLDVSYHGTQILKDVTLDLNAGEILGIVGESGSGKSTLIKAIMGLLGIMARLIMGNWNLITLI